MFAMHIIYLKLHDLFTKGKFTKYLHGTLSLLFKILRFVCIKGTFWHIHFLYFSDFFLSYSI